MVHSFAPYAYIRAFAFVLCFKNTYAAKEYILQPFISNSYLAFACFPFYYISEDSVIVIRCV